MTLRSTFEGLSTARDGIGLARFAISLILIIFVAYAYKITGCTKGPSDGSTSAVSHTTLGLGTPRPLIEHIPCQPWQPDAKVVEMISYARTGWSAESWSALQR